MSYYINCIKRHNALDREIKELIPSMNLRRRMSRVVKMGVTTGLDVVADFEVFGNVDAIITATWLGCIADSEKFMANVIDSDEHMLNPTPFIQSTFNTVGGQIALVKSLKCYNNTFTHRCTSLESGIVDAMLQLNCGGAKAVLVGVFDELTPTVEVILDRLKFSMEGRGEGAIFFVLTKEKLPCSVAVITNININPASFGVGKSVIKLCGCEWSGAIGESIAMVVESGDNEMVTLENDIHGGRHSQISLRCI